MSTERDSFTAPKTFLLPSNDPNLSPLWCPLRTRPVFPLPEVWHPRVPAVACSNHTETMTDRSKLIADLEIAIGIQQSVLADMKRREALEKYGPLPPHHFDTCPGLGGVWTLVPQPMKKRPEYRGKRVFTGQCPKCKKTLYSFAGRWIEAPNQ